MGGSDIRKLKIERIWDYALMFSSTISMKPKKESRLITRGQMTKNVAIFL